MRLSKTTFLRTIKTIKMRNKGASQIRLIASLKNFFNAS